MFHREVRSYETKMLRTGRKMSGGTFVLRQPKWNGDRTAAKMKMAPERPAAGGESCVAGFFM
ncbi:MAG TPA: hypothetical protein H9780_06255 [Candidatus Mediterraneibacter merdavium]|nr:hypothetical protein [Candidatus Mediterraneibacter merdavium]